MAEKKIKKISVNAMDEILKRYESTETIQWNGLEVIVTKTLSLAEMVAFADSVVKSCFDQTSGAYMPEIKDFAIRSNVMERYANFTLPSNVERQYDAVMCSGAFEMILDHINTAQFNELMRAIDAKLRNTADANIQAYITKLDNVATAFSDMQAKMEKMFSGVDAEDISKLMGAISEHGISEEKIVKAYMDQKQQVE